MDIVNRADGNEAEMPGTQAPCRPEAKATHFEDASKPFLQREPFYPHRGLPWSLLLNSEGRCDGSEQPSVEFCGN